MRLISYLLAHRIEGKFPSPYILPPELEIVQLWVAVRHAAEAEIL